MATTLTDPIIVEDDQQFLIRGIAWRQYVTISDALPERRDLRVIYLDGRLTLMTTSRRHDWFADCLGHFVVAVANGCGILWEPAGRSTFRRDDLEVGVEGDQTYYFGAHAEQMKGPQDIDLTTQPPPDLAIEVEVTHPADDSMGVWGRLGVPEVWRFGVDRRTLSFWLRRPDGIYAPTDRSAGLPMLTSADVSEQIGLADSLGTAAWYAQLGDWVRNVLVPRLDQAR